VLAPRLSNLLNCRTKNEENAVQAPPLKSSDWRKQLMILAYHSIFSSYGFWLPNDPRGSGSDIVRKPELYRYGPATKVTTRQSVAGAVHDRVQRMAAKTTLQHPLMEFTAQQIVEVAHGFAQACSESGYLIHACGIMPDHVHLVIGGGIPYGIRRVVGHLKTRATQALRATQEWPNDQRTVWSDHGWNVHLLELKQVYNAIAYAQDNPLKNGLAPQNWSFVVPFDANAIQDKGTP
jgi:REP element-mobilizing transposase RayT